MYAVYPGKFSQLIGDAHLGGEGANMDGLRIRRRPHALPAATLLLLLAAGWLWAAGPGPLRAGEIPIIDAHSQVDFSEDMDRIVRLMDEGGVTTTLLAARRRVDAKAVLALAERHPGRIVPSVRTKGGKYARNDPGYFGIVKKQLKLGGFRAMAEVLLWHAEKVNRKGEIIAPRVVAPPDDERVRAALQVALQKRWPFVMHIEFASTGKRRNEFMRKMEALVAAHPEHPFALIHMGQLDAREVARLIEAHPNLVFLTAHTTPLSVRKSSSPWTNMFSGKRLAPQWKALVTRHPDRFVLAFDNVWEAHWGPFYLKQIALWRKALADLPHDVAHAVAHKNAERLWRLPPAQGRP